VRDGLVAVERDGTQWTTSAGEALLLTSTGTARREPIAIAGPEWSWVDRLAEPFILEGATVTAFLEWIRREEALVAVLPASGLAYRREGTRLLIAPDPQRR